MKENTKYQVCVITGTRAEYGVLRPLLFKLRNQENIELRLVVTGSHLSGLFGNTQNEIIKDGFCEYIKIPIPLSDDSKEGMAISTGIAITKFAELFSEYKPNIVVVLGDRYEIFAAVSSAHLIGIPVAHISGGDVTEGAVDDAIRHCVTKMSYLHFSGCEQSAKRIIQMGEQPERVFNVGELGVENCLNVKLMERNTLAKELFFDGIMDRYAIVTFHPVTMEDDTAEEQVYELIRAMDSFKGMNYVITMANADAGGRKINDVWLKESQKHSNWLVVTSLGVVRYLSAVKYAEFVLGNSSSGIIEVPAMGIPTVNIGDRQKGRMMAESVICCNPEESSIVAAMEEVLKKKFQDKAKYVKIPFGDGTTSEQIMEQLLKYLNSKKESKEKRFYDIDFSLQGEMYE